MTNTDYARGRDGIITAMNITTNSDTQTRLVAQKIGGLLRGGEVLELVGDVGAGKTTFVKGLAKGLGIGEDVQSPTFTISRVYDGRDDLQLAHYDFYRLNDAGIMQAELAEVVRDPKTVTVIEWAAIVEGVLPESRITIEFIATSDEERQLTITNAPQEWSEHDITA